MDSPNKPQPTTSNIRSATTGSYQGKASPGEAPLPLPLTRLSIELELEDCQEERRRLQAALVQLRGENLELNRTLDRNSDADALQARVEDLHKRLDLLHASLSWRITAPLRQLARLFGAQ